MVARVARSGDVFLPSDRARYIAGTKVLVDGGLLAMVRQPR